MTRVRFFLLAMALSLVAACGKGAQTEAPVTATETTAPSAVPAIAAPTPEPVPAANPATPAVEESASAEAEAPVSAGALGKDIMLAGDPSASPAATTWQFEEGKYFNSLPTAQGTSSSPGKIEVAEVFWYGCGHCYNLEPDLSAWVKTLPGDVSFVRIPVMWNPTNEIHGRIYYTAQALGKLDQITPAVFRSIHVDNRPMTDEKDIQLLFEQNGVSAADFNKVFRSFSVESQLKRAKDLTLKYRVKGVPLLVVDGKFTTDGPEIRNHKDLLAVAQELIKRERQRAEPRS
jgi:protein dithiol oxidoreductase (disulfide-forming)